MLPKSSPAPSFRHTDEQLRGEIEALLNCEEQAERFLEAPALEATAEALAEGRSRSMLGRVLGPYEILVFVGAGGMGEVYRARDSRIGRDVAVKVLPPGAAMQPERLRLSSKRLVRPARSITPVT